LRRLFVCLSVSYTDELSKTAEQIDRGDILEADSCHMGPYMVRSYADLDLLREKAAIRG